MLVATASLAGALTAGVAMAADLQTPAHKAAPPVQVSNWTGFYGGINGGYAWGGRTTTFTANDDVSHSLFNTSGTLPHPAADWDVNGGFGGAQIGYNWQVHPQWLLGVESDFQFAGIEGSGTVNHSMGTAPTVTVVSETIKWFGTVRGRLGYLAGNDLLLFGTGGFAYGQVRQSANWIFPATTAFGGGGFGVACTAGVPCYAGASSAIETGWTAGGGAEWAIRRRLTFKAEYLYVNLGSRSVTMSGLVLPPGNFLQSSATAHADVDFHAVRAGLNYRFH
jgi:outer membrane immunogenic protein